MLLKSKNKMWRVCNGGSSNSMKKKGILGLENDEKCLPREISNQEYNEIFSLSLKNKSMSQFQQSTQVSHYQSSITRYFKHQHTLYVH